MKGSGFSSLPTVQARDVRSGDQPDGPRQQRKAATGWSQNLNDVAEGQWPTPMAGTPAQNGNSAAGNSDFSRRAEELAQAMWYTPNTPNGGRKLQEGTSATGVTPDGIKRQVGLQNQARLWTTPQAHDVTARGSGQKPSAKAGNACLATDAVQWGTPRASDAEKGGPNQSFGAGGIPLPAQAAQWTTPSAAQDTKGAQADAQAVLDRSGKHQIGLADATLLFSHPAPETAQLGPTLSQLRLIWRPLRASLIASHGRAVWRRLWIGRNKRRLNPLFVEWLMGWPPGHALCVCSATEFTHWQRRMRGALSRLPMASGPWIWQPPAEAPPMMQMSMFDDHPPTERTPNV